MPSYFQRMPSWVGIPSPAESREGEDAEFREAHERVQAPRGGTKTLVLPRVPAARRARLAGRWAWDRWTAASVSEGQLFLGGAHGPCLLSPARGFLGFTSGSIC